jgi:VanZ family protein
VNNEKKDNPKNRVMLLWLTILVVVIIGELLPGSSPPIRLLSGPHFEDKFIHFGAYVVLAFLPVFGLPLRTAVQCVIATELIGLSLEVIQHFLPDRSCDLYDAAANTAGVLAGVAVAIVARSRVAQKCQGS